MLFSMYSLPFIQSKLSTEERRIINLIINEINGTRKSNDVQSHYKMKSANI
jgi:hypothetical protein